MKLFLLTSCLFGYFGICGFAQITVTNTTFPDAGDTLLIAIDNLPEAIEITPPGGEQSWNFSNLSAPFTQSLIYRPASEGEVSEEVPSADIFTKFTPESESYYKVTDNTFELIAFYGQDPAGLGLNTFAKFEPPIVERRAPMNFFDQNISSSALLITFATEDIPQEVLDNLPIPVTPDSVRLRVAMDRVDLVDAWGSLILPGGTYDVLREKRTEFRETRIDLKFPVIGWQDWTDIIAPFLAPIGSDTTVTYNFFSNEAKEVIAIVTMDSQEENATQVIYKSNDIINKVKTVVSRRPGIYAFPNPAINDVRLEFTDLKPAYYSIKIFNILGIEVFEKKYWVDGTRTEKIDLTNLRKGIYLYSLENESGKTLITKRLMILRP